MSVRECSVVAAPALVLVASSLTVEALPPVGMPEHDPDDPSEAAMAAQMRAAAQAEQDAAAEAAGPATHCSPRHKLTQETRVQNALDDVAGRYYSPRHSMPSNARNEGRNACR